ncbi:MAG: segregation/condensation protein A [Oscillospiraceae bacterium]|nr:segregation/condensation protein A [Oscillospiraceae bacterium]
MPELSFHLPVFEGPLDLLLHLIAKHKLNIRDIEISILLEQYLLYMHQCAEQDYELAGEFLAMAAKLIWMKTAALLPAPEEAEAVKKELEGALIEYSLCKIAAERLRNIYRGDVLFTRKPAPIPADLTYRRVHTPDVLAAAYQSIGVKKLPEGASSRLAGEKIHAVVQMHHQVTSVGSKVIFLLRQFFTQEKVNLNAMFAGVTGKSDRVALFLAVLELTRHGRTYISDDGTEILMRDRSTLLHGKRQRRLNNIESLMDTT